MYRLKGVNKIFAIYLLAAVAVGSIALPSSWKVFQSTYNISAGSRLGKAKCLVCHTSEKGKTLNSYGKALAVILKKEGTKKVSEEALRQVEKLDSSGTGQSNIQRIHADQLPGG